jgi:hypothetical protein
MSEWTKARARLANATRYGVDPDTLAELRRDLRAARLAEAIEQAVSVEPPLTSEQRVRLARLLCPTE